MCEKVDHEADLEHEQSDQTMNLQQLEASVEKNKNKTNIQDGEDTGGWRDGGYARRHTGKRKKKVN